MSLKELMGVDPTAVVKEMRQLGITSFSYADITLTLGEERAVAEVLPPSQFDDDDKKNICSCGHQPWEHNEEKLCLLGCESCGEPKKEE